MKAVTEQYEQRWRLFRETGWIMQTRALGKQFFFLECSDFRVNRKSLAEFFLKISNIKWYEMKL